MNAEEYIKDRLTGQIDWYNRRAGKMQRAYKFWQALKLICALSIPIATLFMEHKEKAVFCWAVTIAVLGALIILIEGLQKLYDFKDLWKKYRLTAEALQSQKVFFQTETGGYAKAKEPFKLLVARCEQIMSEEKASWDEMMEEADE
ncbi:DUF4231 domain-containing protein [Crocinitomix catalasitica]|nr:DUF4231 domain-containing protein [Crocinitomix catalasitica]